MIHNFSAKQKLTIFCNHIYPTVRFFKLRAPTARGVGLLFDTDSGLCFERASVCGWYTFSCTFWNCAGALDISMPSLSATIVRFQRFREHVWLAPLLCQMFDFGTILTDKSVHVIFYINQILTQLCNWQWLLTLCNLSVWFTKLRSTAVRCAARGVGEEVTCNSNCQNWESDN